jgi:amiloride-sensitive sodium channel
MLERCIWKGSVSKCDSLFQPINTTEGVCCSFNNYAFKKSNYNSKVLSSIPKLPQKIAACGYQTGLSVLLNPEMEDYYATEVGIAGFKVLISF